MRIIDALMSDSGDEEETPVVTSTPSRKRKLVVEDDEETAEPPRKEARTAREDVFGEEAEGATNDVIAKETVAEAVAEVEEEVEDAETRSPTRPIRTKAMTPSKSMKGRKDWMTYWLDSTEPRLQLPRSEVESGSEEVEGQD